MTTRGLLFLVLTSKTTSWCIPFAKAVFGNLLLPGHHQLVVFVLHEDLISPHLIDLPDDDGADHVLVLLDHGGFFQVAYLLGQGLLGRLHDFSPEVEETDLLCQFISYLVVLVDQEGLAKGNLPGLVFQVQVIYDLTLAKALDVAFVDVDDDVKILVRTIFFTNHGTEHLFQDSHKGGPVDVFEARKFRERFYEVDFRVYNFLPCHFC